MTIDEFEARYFVVFELMCHRKHPTHSWCDTLNRLLRKQAVFGNASGARIPRDEMPTIVPERLSVSREKWSLQELLLARNWQPHDRDEPQCDRCPILVLDLSGNRFVIDGGTRVNRRIRDQDQGPHDVVVMQYPGSGPIN